jgi:hypothetical protein
MKKILRISKKTQLKFGLEPTTHPTFGSGYKFVFKYDGFVRNEVALYYRFEKIKSLAEESMRFLLKK